MPGDRDAAPAPGTPQPTMSALLAAGAAARALSTPPPAPAERTDGRVPAARDAA